MPRYFLRDERITMRILGLFYVVSLFVIPSSLNASEEFDAFLDRDAICDAWESTYGSIRTMSVKFTTEQTSSGPNRASKTIRTNVERIEQGELHHTAYSYGVNNDADLENPIIASFDGINSYEYITIYRQGSINPGLLGKATDNMNEITTFMLMDDLSFPGDEAHEPSLIPRFLCYMKGDNVQVGKKLEHVAGEACHVITITTKSEEYNADHEIKLWVTHNKGMLLLKHEFHDYIKNINQVSEVSEVACTELETGTVWYPKKVHNKIEHPDRLIERTIVTEEFKPNIKIDKSVFKVNFPTGTRVTDNVIGITYVVGGENIQIDAESPIPQDKQQSDHTEIDDDNSQVVHEVNIEQSTDQADMPTMGLANKIDNESMFGVRQKNYLLIVSAGAILLFVIVIMGILLLNSHSKSTRQSGV